MSYSKNKFIGLFILLLMLIRSMVLPLTYLEYHLNKDYIVDKFCENKFRPEMLCDGKCYLAKKLAQRQQQTTDAESIVFYQLLTSPIVCQVHETCSFEPFFPQLPSRFHYQSPFSGRNFPTRIFRPPAKV